MVAAGLFLALPMAAVQSPVPSAAGLRPGRESSPQSGLAAAREALLEGQADRAAAKLKELLSVDASNGSAHLLLCRVWLSEELPERAVSECQTALQDGLAGNSEAQDWTGRALGREAEHAGIVSGLKFALEVRTAFETAVQLDPKSEAACVDLGEYYAAAPAIVGGGATRALALATRIEPTLPAVSHRIRAMVAEKDKDYGTAEAEFEAEARVGDNAGVLVDLACFYERRHQEARAAQTARQTVAKDSALDSTVVEASSILDDVHQTGLALDTMRHYIDRGTHSDTAPVFRVHAMVGKMLARDGDTEGAREHFKQALAMASQYKPAQKGLASL